VGRDGRDNPTPRTSATPPPHASEEAARARLESLHGQSYTEEEWAEIRRSLQAFAAIVARWNSDERRSKEPLVSLAIPPGSG